MFETDHKIRHLIIIGNQRLTIDRNKDNNYVMMINGQVIYRIYLK